MYSKRDRKYLNLACRLAEQSSANKRHGCVIVKGGRVISTAYNAYINKPHFVSPEHMDRCSVHAEVAALRKVKGSTKGATIYVARLNNRGEERYSAPCEDCSSVLDERGIRKVVYTVWTQ